MAIISDAKLTGARNRFARLFVTTLEVMNKTKIKDGSGGNQYEIVSQVPPVTFLVKLDIVSNPETFGFDRIFSNEKFIITYPYDKVLNNTNVCKINDDLFNVVEVLDKFDPKFYNLALLSYMDE